MSKRHFIAHPVKKFLDLQGNTYCEKVDPKRLIDDEENQIAAFWSVYEIKETKGDCIEEFCICDCTDEDNAMLVASALNNYNL